MHHRSNAEWFWNSAANDHLAMPAPNTLSVHRASRLSSNAITTDVGICVGMRNVNLNYCNYSVPRPLLPPNWYTNNYAQYLHHDEAPTKYYQIPSVLVSNGFNTLVVNEYSSANMRDEVFKFHQNMSTTRSANCIEELKYNGESEMIPTISKSVTVNRDESSDLSLTPPKKKWIRHYMMGE